VWVETGKRGSNHGIVRTKDGLVLIDGPQKPSDTIALKAKIAQHGDLKDILNTEPHGDHWTSNAYFDVPAVSHRGVRERMLETDMEAHAKRVATFGPDEAPLLEGYKANLPVITFEKDMKMFVGDHTFRLINMPGHTPYQLAILIEEEGVAFTTDHAFCKVQMWIQEGDPDQWLESLESLRALRADKLVPGHGPITDNGYLDEQGAFVSEWVDYVKGAVDRGQTKEQAIESLTALTDRYPMDVEQDGMAPHVMQMNVANLYDYHTAAGIHGPR
jgi:glyoxylase-like metal-dependent hydrolase (beta-lactamase superfamily II)